MKDKKPELPDDDTDLFRQAMEDVTPLNQDKIDPDSAPKIKKSRAKMRKSKPISVFGELEYATPVDSDEVLFFARDGIQPKAIARLKKGQHVIEGKIDLHGMTVENAGHTLQRALKNAVADGIRCVLVVHGRGKGSFDNKPAIKTHVNQWLRNSADVLAFHSAQPYHGGTGAVYVLLKRVRD